MTHVRMGLLYKKADWTEAAFREHWLHQHGALVKHAPGLGEYWQNHVIDRVQRGIDFARGPWEFDGFSQLRVSDPKHPFGEGDLPARVRADEQHFVGGLHIIEAEQTEVVAVPAPEERARLKKRISLIRRRPDSSEADFRKEWAVHAGWVRQMPGVRGYRQNAIVAREVNKGVPSSYDALPIDGLVEFWFESTETLQDAFGSPAGKQTMQHATTFLSEITAYLVDEHRII
ncbi:EthD family reductase [Pararobbsia silviterrae]|uniref:EthD family reductase n=1 Tax=Pararobbsia silviterrae TaxID=1792498 RepID=A0A494YCA9_9BURK|nr:EthD family reductase [Pararobbsia silviterrae]RKP57624.1 EthD family reductase [Pararobbsia silviterrae]